MCFYEGTPLQPLRLHFFGSEFLSHPLSQLPFLFSLFAGRIIRVKARRAHERSTLPNCTTPETLFPPHTYHLSPAKVSSDVPRTAGECFYLHFAK